jgi:hypothetical protein
MKIKQYVNSIISVIFGTFSVSNYEASAGTSEIHLSNFSQPYNLFEVSIPIKNIVDKENEILICACGQYKSKDVGLNLRLMKSLIPFLKITAKEIEPTNQGNWVENGCVFELMSPEANSLLDEIRKLLHLELPLNMRIKDQVRFETALLLGNVKDIIPLKDLQNSSQQVLISATSFLAPDKDERTFNDNNCLKIKVEFVHSFQPLCHFQLLIILDLDQKKLIIQEKDNEMRNGFINTFYQDR